MNHIKQVSLSIFSIFLFVTTPLLADADVHAKDEVFIKSAMQKMNIATQNKDLAAYLLFLCPDYTDIGEGGKVNAHNKTQMSDQLGRMFARAMSITVGPTSVARFVFDKQGATVYESGSLTIMLMISGQKSMIQSEGTYRDFWVKNGTGWLEKSSSSLSSKTTLNGKPAP